MASLIGEAVLIVDDEFMIADCIASFVELDGGMVVGPAASVREALDLLATRHVSAAVLDVNLRDGEVAPIAEALRLRDIPFVVQTGAMIPARLKAALGDVPAFYKPYRLEEMVGALGALAADRGARRRARGHALIIEDEEVMASILEGYLRNMGFSTVECAGTEDEAVAAAVRRRPDIVFADILLGEGNGLAAASAIRRLCGAPITIIVTANPRLASGMAGIEVIAKPFTSAEIASAVAAVGAETISATRLA